MNTELSLDEKRALLQEIPFFAALPATTIDELASQATQQHFSASTIIYALDDAGDSLYLLASGEVALERPDPNPRRSRRAANVVAPATFGEMSIFDANPRSFTAICLTDAVTLRLPQALVLDCVRNHPEATLSLLTQLGQRLRTAHIEIAELRRPQSKAAHALFDKLNDL